MKKSRFSDEQTICMIKEQESGIRTVKVCRKYGVSSASFYKYKAKFGELDVSDAFTDGRRFRILAVIDDFSMECLALVADTSLSGLRVTRELSGLIKHRGKPNTIVSDNGTELTCMVILKWCHETNIG